MSGPTINYAPRSDATPEAQISVLCAIYKLCLESHARKEATRPGSPEDGTKIKEDSADEHRST
jgi:hypothetical protein